MGKKAFRGRGRDLNEWNDLFAEQRASGLSQQAFCQMRGLSTSAFYQAKSRTKTMGSAPSVLSEFMAVSVEPSAPMSEPRDSWDVELALGSGVVLRVRRWSEGG